MDSFDELLQSLLFDGRVILQDRPRVPASPERTLQVLRRAFDSYCLEVSGAPIELDVPVAARAAALVLNACWALVNREDAPADLERSLAMPPAQAPTSPSQHLSADLLFHFVPQLYRRARAIDRDDLLAAMLEDLLRRWPLSGVLANLDDGPAAPVDLGGHEGLMLLYAERWARHENPAWRPSGRPDEYIELVLGEAGRARPVSPAAGMNPHV